MDPTEFAARREKAPVTKRVPLCADGDLLRELEEARAAPKGNPLRDRIVELEAAVAEQTMHVVVKALDPDDYETLKREHRPKDAKAGEYDERTFPKALVAASMDPHPAPDDFERMWSGLTKAERSTLFFACHDLNETVLDLGFTLPDTATPTGIGRSSTT